MGLGGAGQSIFLILVGLQNKPENLFSFEFLDFFIFFEGAIAYYLPLNTSLHSINKVCFVKNM